MKPQAKLITNRSNIAYLSNFTGSAGFMLITKNSSYLFTDFRYIQRAKNSIKKEIKIVDTTKMWRNPTELKQNWQKILRKHRIKTLGIEESNLTIARFKKFKKISMCRSKAKAHIKFIDISGKIEANREIKNKREIGLIQKSQAINEKVFAEIKKIVRTHLRSKSRKKLQEIELAWKIKELGHRFGAQDVSFDPIVGFGKNSAIVHHSPGKTTLKKGDLILIDMGMKYKGYCSDMTRMIFTAKPTPKQTQIYNLVLASQLAGIKDIKAGITGKKADKIIRDTIDKAGYGEEYGHAGGHGIGLDIHESPSISDKYIKKIRANTVVTVEPGIYLPGKFGVRIEDMILVTKSGNKVLTKIPKKLKSCIL